MFCPMCGAPNEDEAAFCGNCGAALAADEVPAEGTTPEGEFRAAADVETPAAPEEPPALLPPPVEGVVEPPTPRQPTPPPRAGSGAGLPTNGLAIASLILGVGGLTILPLLGSIVAIILGYIARNQIRSRPGRQGGAGIAMAGIVLGWIAVGLTVLGGILMGGLTLCGLCGAFGTSG